MHLSRNLGLGWQRLVNTVGQNDISLVKKSHWQSCEVHLLEVTWQLGLMCGNIWKNRLLKQKAKVAVVLVLAVLVVIAAVAYCKYYGQDTVFYSLQ